jgi:hypothetical protein
MKTNRLHAFTTGGSIYQRMFVVSLILALLFASLPMGSVFSAPASEEQPWETVDLKLEWKNKLTHLRAEGYFYDHVRFNPADFENAADLELARMYLDKYRIALRQANTVVLNHTGFDYKGNVTNPRLAYETVHDLADYLHMMYGFRDKIDEVPSGR